jgi:isoleucyl-tRNA synthetase
LRVKETVEIICSEIDYSGEVIFDDRLGEVFYGKEWEGKTWSEYARTFPVLSERFYKRNSSAENFEDVRRRVMEFLYEINEKYEGKNIVIVGHGGPLSLLDLSASGKSVKEMSTSYRDDMFYNAEIREVDFRSLPHNENYDLDLHRPYIDNVVLVDENGNKLKRIPEVFDCWLESGSMSFAQYHYPFENKEIFEKVIQLGIDDKFGFKEFIANFLKKEPISLIKRWEELSKDRFGCVILNQKLLMEK